MKLRRIETLAVAVHAFVLSSSVVAQEPGPEASAQEPAVEPQEDAPPKVPEQDLRDPQLVLTGIDLIQADFPGSWPMFGENIRMKIGGYVKADFLYDVNGTTDPFQFLMSTIPVEGSPEHGDDGYFSFFARETRFNIDVRRIGESKPLRALVEGDFFDADTQFRLRHAYIVSGDLLVGQTWTTLSVLESLPNLIDFAAGDALFGGRSTQIRYQHRVSESWQIAASLESLGSPGIENPSGLSGKPREALPLLALKAEDRWDGGFLATGGSLALLSWDGGSAGPDADALQWAGMVAGRQYLGEDDYLTWNMSYGNGAGENIIAFAGSDANAVLTPSGELERMRSTSVILGYMHRWSSELESNFSYAYGWLDTPPERAPDALARGGIGHVNLIWQPTKHLSYGIEYMRGAQRTADDSYGEGSRIQIMAKLAF